MHIYSKLKKNNKPDMIEKDYGLAQWVHAGSLETKLSEVGIIVSHFSFSSIIALICWFSHCRYYQLTLNLWKMCL